MGDDASQKKPGATSRDVLLIHGVTEDGKGLEVLRARQEGLELGQVRPLEHGKPLQGEIVKLRPRADAPFVCDVETEFRLPESHGGSDPQRAPESRRTPEPRHAPEPRRAGSHGAPASRGASESRGAPQFRKPAALPQAPSRKGPAQVASEAYRQNWDAIWSSSAAKKNDLPN